MIQPERSPAAEVMTSLILGIFRANNLIVGWGDKLVGDLGLTSARWQVMGAIVAAVQPQPVAWLARDLGGNRQNIQRIVNDLAREGLVEFRPNPHHRRAQLVVLTEKGQAAYDAAIARYNPQVEALTAGLPPEDLATAARIITALRERLESGE